MDEVIESEDFDSEVAAIFRAADAFAVRHGRTALEALIAVAAVHISSAVEDELAEIRDVLDDRDYGD